MKRYILIVLIFLIVAGLSLRLYHQQIKPEDAFETSDFPMQIGEWTGEDIPVEENVYEILETRNLLLREYKKDNSPSVVLYIIYADKNRKASHPPEICLTGGGVAILDKKEIELKVNTNTNTIAIKSNYLVVEKGKAREIFLYWFKAGRTFTPKYLNQQFRIMINELQGKSSGGAMIRLSTKITKDEKDALERLTEFTKKILPTVIKVIP